LREYAVPYSTILSGKFHHLYIDAFAAGGTHVSRTTGNDVPGSALIALRTEPQFKEYHFIDANPARVDRRTIYYLFFASPNNTGKKIVEYIFDKHRKKQGL
jgi:hypothetical protein